jgi:hypothetical protein
MSDVDWTAIMAGFAREFRPEEIGISTSSKGGRPYVDARSIDERLDDVVGPENWHITYRVVDPAAYAVECTLTVHGISKSDVGYSNNPAGTLDKSGRVLESEPLKAAYSDALKRAAVHWGIGRYLYPYASKRQREGGEPEHDERPSGRPNPPATPAVQPPANHGGMVAQDGDFGADNSQNPSTEQQWKKMWAIHKRLEEAGIEHPRVPAKEPYLSKWSYEQGEAYIVRLDSAKKAAGIA